ncbi:MAG: hypothetical protein IJ128_03455 [Firmicutes bacterium]|nr:hypothetical protein [Bacillota bacterium]
MKRRLIILLAAAAAALCMLCPQVTLAYEEYTGYVDTSWFDSQDPQVEYKISTEAELRGLASLVNEEQFLWKPNRTESFEDVTFVLTRDITLTDDWTPIGIDEQITFAGTFDGKGHSITGLKIEAEDPYCGLFGYLSGTVRNLYVEGDISTSGNYCGGIAGFINENAKVNRCQSNVQVAGLYNVGGIVGESSGGLVRASINYGEVIGASMVGGIVGESRGGTIRLCGNRGLIYSNGAGSFNNGTGGVAGRSVSASTLSLCYNVGDIISSNEATGGITGYTNSTGSSIKNCYSIGTIRIDDPQVETTVTLDPNDPSGRRTGELSGKRLPVYAGGIAGYVGSQNLTIVNCYNAGRIKGADYTGGIIGKCENELYSSTPASFSNNYYAKGSFDSAIAADRDDKRMRIRGAATEVYDSAFGHMASSLGEAYMDDKAGAYGSQGYPVLTWQEEIQTDENLAVLRHIDKEVRKQLHEFTLMLSSGEVSQGQMLLRFFNKDLIYDMTQGDNNPLKKKGNRK